MTGSSVRWYAVGCYVGLVTYVYRRVPNPPEVIKNVFDLLWFALWGSYFLFVFGKASKSESKSRKLVQGGLGHSKRGGGMQNGQNGQVPLLLPEIKFE